MATIDIWFYQLRQGDKFLIDGVEYMKVWRSKTTTNDQYNCKRTSDNTYRFVPDNMRVTPTDDYYRRRISPIQSDVHEF